LSVKELVPWLWIAALAAVFWLLIIRPASKRQKAMAQLQSALAVGDEIVLTSGVFGTIAEITDDHVAVEVAPGVVIRVVRGAIASVRRDEVDDATADESTEAEAPAPGDETGER
jgi:preprotein translocase subunit YajC